MDTPTSLQPESPHVPWTTRDVWLGISSFIIWIVLVIGLRMWMAQATIEGDLRGVGLLVSLGELLLLVPVWLLTIRKYNIGWQQLGLRPFAPAALRLGCGLMLVSFLFNAIYGMFLGLFGLRMQVDLIPIFESLPSPLLFFIGGAVIAPVVEEIFFRGFVFAGLRPRYGWQKAAVISAVLFALLHFTLTAILPIFILGLIFAYLYQISESIWPPILMHMLTNALALGAAYAVANADRLGLVIEWFAVLIFQ